jgi:hypothetical protein
LRRGEGGRGRREEKRRGEEKGKDENERETKEVPPTMTHDKCGQRQRRRNDLLPQ